MTKRFSTPSAPFPTVASDGIPWDVQPAPPRVVAVGDVHGDLESLANILLERAVIDVEGRWIAGNAHLVLLGDLVGGNKYSRLLLNFVMRLEKRSRRPKWGGARPNWKSRHSSAAKKRRQDVARGKIALQKFPRARRFRR
jgi:hypothetical protein